MKPYYERGGVTIYHGDCLSILPDIVADVVVTDPPYNARNMGARKMVYEGSQFPMTPERYQRFCMDWFNACADITPNIAFTSGIAHAWSYPQPLWVLAWNKPAAAGRSLLGGFNVWEPILVYGKPGNRFWQDAYTLVAKKGRGPEREHPCPKPIELWAWLVKGMAKEGQTVLDPFMGSGTTLRAAKSLGLAAIGIEKEERYCEIAAQRLAQEVLV